MKQKISDSPKTLKLCYPTALANPDLLRGWKRALTLYCRRKAAETGKAEAHYRKQILAVLVKAEYDIGPVCGLRHALAAKKK